MDGDSLTLIPIPYGRSTPMERSYSLRLQCIPSHPQTPTCRDPLWKGCFDDLIRPHLKGTHLQRTVQRIIQACQICAKNNPKTEHTPVKNGIQYKELCPLKDWQVDFTQVPKTTGNFKFLLVFVDTFSRWVEAQPSRTKKLTEVAKLLRQITPRFGLPHGIQNNLSLIHI